MKKLKGYIVIGALHLLALLPWCLIQKVGTVCGWLIWIFPTRAREVARINLAHSFPDLSPDEVDELARKNMIVTAKTFAENICVWLWPTQKTLSRIKEVEGLEILQKALAEEKGVIGVTFHLGNWEAINQFFSSQCDPLIFYRPIKWKELENLLHKHRTKVGNRAVPSTKEGVLSIIKEVRKGGVVGIPADPEPARTAGLFVPFFGTTALTSKFIPSMAAGGKATVIFTCAIRLDDCSGYKIIFEEAPEDIYSNDMTVAIHAMGQVIEDWIKRWPLQYMWCIKRFKNRPDGEEEWY